MDISEKFNNSNPQLTANFVNRMFFWWMKPLFYSRKGQNIQMKDLYHVLPQHSSKLLGDSLERAWYEELQNSASIKRKPSLLRVTWKTFGWLFLYYGVHVFFICVILRGLQPYVLALVIEHFHPFTKSSTEEAYCFASVLVIMIILQATVGHHSVVGRKDVGMRISTGYSALIYRKALRLSASASSKYDPGKIVNLLSNDVGKFEDVCMFLHYIWVLPLQCILMLYFFWSTVNFSITSGLLYPLIATLFLIVQTVFVQKYLGKITGRVRAKVAAKADERIRLMSEILSGIRVIKMYAWEKPFENMVFLARKSEIDSIALKSYLRGVSSAASLFAETTTLILVIFALVLDGSLEAHIIYAIAQYFGMIKTMITVFYPRAVSSSAEARVSIKRIEVLKCNMDGTSPEEIIKSPSITAIAVDTQTPKLYWADSINIQSSDYAGNQRQIVARISNIVPSLGVSGNRIFWTKQPDPISLRTLWTCTISSSGICNENDIKNIPFDDPKSIKIYTGQETSVSNPCENGNGGCKHLCLRSVNNGHSCACFIGHRLEDDGKSCAPATEFILYSRGDFIRGRILDSDRQTFSDSIPPIRFHQKALNEKRTIDFDYNFYTNTLAFSDDQSINTVNMLKEEPQGIYSMDKCLKCVSFDWVTNDIYYVRDNCFTGQNNAIVVLKPREDKYLLKTLNTFSPNQGHPRSLAVHPNKGCYFFTMLLDGEAQIYRVRGLKTTPFSNDKLSINETGLAIDLVEDRLYWFSQNTTELHNANLEGEDVKSIDVSVVREPRSIGIHGRYAYISNLTSIWRFDKVSGRGATRLAPRSNDDEKEMIAGVRIFSQNVQKISADNFCAIQNGDCEQFCFQRPKIIGDGNAVNVTEELTKICLCDDFQTIQIDGTCV